MAQFQIQSLFDTFAKVPRGIFPTVKKTTFLSGG